ncbi:MAG TPA: hypothetical protein VGM67_17090 [Gemmatimonadaceae bacterium]
MGLLSACSDNTEATRPLAQRTTASFAASPSALHISTVSFDLAVQSTHLGGKSRSMQAHVNRSATANGWRTTITLIEDPREARLPAAPWRPNQLVIDESDHLTVYRADGQVARVPDPSRFPGPNGAPAARTTAASQLMAGTGWLDDLLLASDARAQESAAKINGAARGDRDAQGLDHYVKTAGGHSIDYSVDPATGIVKGLSLSDGQRTSRAAFQYVNTASGVSIQTSSHFEHSGGRITDSQTMTISNVVIDGKGMTS